MSSPLQSADAEARAADARAQRPVPAAGTAPATAVVLAPAAPLPWEGGTVLGRLLAQLGGLGVGRALVLTRPEAEQDVAAALAGATGTAPPAELRCHATAAEDLRAIAAVARDARGPVLVAQGDVVTQREALAGLLADPRVGTGVLSTGQEGLSGCPMYTDRGRVVSASSSYHTVARPTAEFLGVIKVMPAETPALAVAAEGVAELPAGPRDDVAALALVGLVRGGAHVGNSWVRKLFWARPRTAEEAALAERRITEYDEDRVLLDSAVKANDGFFTTFFVSPYSKYIARWAARRGLTPNAVTTVSLLIGVLAAAAFATGERAGLIAGAVLLQAAFTTDCVDGQLARYTRTFSKLGAWLDSVFDRTKEYVVFAGLAIGASRAGDDVWVLAAAAMALQTVRHMLEFTFAATRKQAIAAARQPPLDQPGDGFAPRPRAAAGPTAAATAAPAGEPAPAATTPTTSAPTAPPSGNPLRRALGTWTELLRRPAVRWARKVLGFPIGERFAAISLCAALWDARTTFTVLLVWGGVAALVTGGGRLLRSLA